jgi:hypothetical protein
MKRRERNMKHSTWKVLAGAVIAASLVIAPLTAASATEEVPVEETTAVVDAVVEQAVQEQPAEGPAPEAPPAPAPVVEQAPVEAPAPAPEVVQEAAIQPLTKPVEEPFEKKCEQSGEGWGVKVDTTGDPATVTVNADPGYLIDAYCVKAGSKEDAVHVIPVDPPAASVIIDHPVKDSVSHYQVHQIKKPVDETPTPRSCIAAGPWYTEGDDIEPTQTFEGLVFQDSDPSKAVGIRVPVDGNLQGWAPVSFVSTGGTSEFFFRMVVDLSAHGGPAYKSLSFPGYSTIDSASVAYQTGKSIADMAIEWPKAVIKSVGFQTNSAASSEFKAVLKSVAGPCAVRNFVPPVQEPTCTTVQDTVTLNHDGVFSVEGEWDTVEYDVPFTGTLADIGTVLDIDADPIGYVGLHIDTAQGTIVFEEEPSYGGNLWSTSAWDGVESGMGYAAFGSIEEFIAYNGDVVVTGIRLLYTHPEASTTTVTSFTIGCTTYEFTPVPEQPADKVVEGEWSAPEYDCDNEAGDEVLITRTVTTTPYVWDAESYEWVEGEPVVEQEPGVYVVTSADIEALECVTPTPPVSTPPASTPVKQSPAALAVTGGGDAGTMVPLAAVLMSVLGGALIAFGAIRRRQTQA